MHDTHIISLWVLLSAGNEFQLVVYNRGVPRSHSSWDSKGFGYAQLFLHRWWWPELQHIVTYFHYQNRLWKEMPPILYPRTIFLSQQSRRIYIGILAAVQTIIYWGGQWMWRSTFRPVSRSDVPILPRQCIVFSWLEIVAWVSMGCSFQFFQLTLSASYRFRPTLNGIGVFMPIYCDSDSVGVHLIEYWMPFSFFPFGWYSV